MPTRNQLADEVVAAFGGATALASALNWPITTVQSWGTSRYGIPDWRKPAIMSLARKRKIDLPEGFANDRP